jgi:hypothetical protein
MSGGTLTSAHMLDLLRSHPRTGLFRSPLRTVGLAKESALRAREVRRMSTAYEPVIGLEIHSV